MVAGTSAPAVVTVERPVATATAVRFQTANGSAKFPDAVLIPAGAASASIVFSGVRPGVEEVTAIPADPAYETAYARVQVGGAAVLKLVAVSALPDPVVVRLTDANGLTYPNALIAASASAGGSVEPAVALTDAQGEASFHWAPGGVSAGSLQLEVKGLEAPVALVLTAGAAVPLITAVVNAASFGEGVAAGGLATILGTGLMQGSAPPQVLLNGAEVRLLYASATQINFYVPAETRLGSGTITVAAGGERSNAAVTVADIQPGIFPGAVLHAGTAVSAVDDSGQSGRLHRDLLHGARPDAQRGRLPADDGRADGIYRRRPGHGDFQRAYGRARSISGKRADSGRRRQRLAKRPDLSQPVP